MDRWTALEQRTNLVDSALAYAATQSKEAAEQLERRVQEIFYVKPPEEEASDTQDILSFVAALNGGGVF